MAVRSVSDFRMTKGEWSRFSLSFEITARLRPPTLPSVSLLSFPLIFPTAPPLVATPPPTFLACRGNKSRKCYRKEFTRHELCFPPLCFTPLDRPLSRFSIFSVSTVTRAAGRSETMGR